jgi:hypothetical protein
MTTLSAAAQQQTLKRRSEAIRSSFALSGTRRVPTRRVPFTAVWRSSSNQIFLPKVVQPNSCGLRADSAFGLDE